MPNILAEIELNEKQIKAFNEELNAWKEKTRSAIAEQVESELKTKYSVKLRKINEEKDSFKAQQEALVEEIKGKMQKVMVKRFTGAMKEVYDELKVEARKEVLGDPRILALEEVKNVVYPLMDETVTKGYVDELQKALKMVEARELENDKLKARLKLKEITSVLSPTVAEAVETFIGDALSEEEVVEKYAKLKNLVGEAKKKKSEEEDEELEDDDEDLDLDDDDEVNEEGDGDAEDDWDEDEDKKKKKKKAKRKDEAKKDDDCDDDDDKDDDEDEDEDDEDEDLDEEFEIKPRVRYNKTEKKDDYVDALNEMLNLAGVPLND